jgi:hypothetical protein
MSRHSKSQLLKADFLSQNDLIPNYIQYQIVDCLACTDDVVISFQMSSFVKSESLLSAFLVPLGLVVVDEFGFLQILR